MSDTRELRRLAHRHSQCALSIPVKPAAIFELLDRLEAAEKERDDVAQQLVQSEQGKRKISEECDALRAKITEMEQQEPVAFGLYSGWALKATYLSEIEACGQRDRRQLTADLGGSLEAYRVVPLYALPGAKGEEK